MLDNKENIPDDVKEKVPWGVSQSVDILESKHDISYLQGLKLGNVSTRSLAICKHSQLANYIAKQNGKTILVTGRGGL
jgi:FlaA1/EpsC-like NDP-sugar epimerase